MIPMDLKQLRYFLTIAEEKQITRAAKKLNMSQPPLSQQLQLLEDELDTILFDRNTRSVELTEAGKALYLKGKALMAQLEDITNEVKEIGKGIRGVLSIGTVKSCLPITSPKMVEFRQKYPGVTYNVWEGDTSSLSSHLINRDIEVAIIRLPLNNSDFSMIKLINEPYVLVVPNSWSMEDTGIKMEKLSGIPLLLLHRKVGTGVYEIIVNECRRFGFEPNVICECPDPNVLISLVAEGLGATLLPRSTASTFPLSNIRIVELENCGIHSEAAIIWLKDRSLSKAAIEFINLFREEYMSQKTHESP
jgi:DNA-binding transcriptional LysR family regulator